MKVSLVVTFVFLWLIGVSSSVNAQSPSGIQNGSFETPSIASYAYRPSSSWTFIGNAGIQHNGSAWGAPNAPDGVQTAFLQYGTIRGAMAPFRKCLLCRPMAHIQYPSIPRCVLTGPVRPSCRSM